MSDEKQQVTGMGILQGSLAQVLGGSLAATIVIGLASFDIYMQAGFESAFGTVISVLAYLIFKGTRLTKGDSSNDKP